MKRAILLFGILIAFLCLPAACLAGAGLSIDKQKGSAGERVTFTVSVDSAPNEVKAFIMDVTYDPSILSFSGSERAALASGGYPMFMVNEYQSGTIRVGGVDPLGTGIAEGQSGDFFTLSFDVKDKGNSYLAFGVLKDDLEGWKTYGGLFQGKKEEKSEDEKPGNGKKGDEEESSAGRSSENKSSGKNSVYSSSTGAASSDSEGEAPESESIGSGLESAAPPSYGNIAPPAPGMGGASGGSKAAASASPLAAAGTFQGLGAPGGSPASQPGEGGSDVSPEKLAAVRNALPYAVVRSFTDNRGAGAETPPPARDRSVAQNKMQAAGSLAPGTDTQPAMLTALLVVALALLVLSLVVAALLAGILLMLVLVYKKLKALEATGQITFKGPLLVVGGNQAAKAEAPLKTSAA